MEKYERVPRTYDNDTEPNEVRIGGMRSQVSASIEYGLNLLNNKEKAHDSIIVKAIGSKMISKAIFTAEIIKLRVPGLHQITEIGTTDIVTQYLPKEEGLDKVEISKKTAFIKITLSKTPLDTTNPGYQAPPEIDIHKKPIRPREYISGGGIRGGHNSIRGYRGGFRSGGYRGGRGGGRGGFRSGFRADQSTTPAAAGTTTSTESTTPTDVNNNNNNNNNNNTTTTTITTSPTSTTTTTTTYNNDRFSGYRGRGRGRGSYRGNGGFRGGRGRGGFKGGRGRGGFKGGFPSPVTTTPTTPTDSNTATTTTSAAPIEQGSEQQKQNSGFRGGYRGGRGGFRGGRGRGRGSFRGGRNNSTSPSSSPTSTTPQ